MRGSGYTKAVDPEFGLSKRNAVGEFITEKRSSYPSMPHTYK
jgi:hypothetical protein